MRLSAKVCLILILIVLVLGMSIVNKPRDSQTTIQMALERLLVECKLKGKPGKSPPILMINPYENSLLSNSSLVVPSIPNTAIISVPLPDYLPMNMDVRLTNKTHYQEFMNLIEKFTEVCEREGIVYFMHGGTLLGSWRHHGWIPWDDDLDMLVFNITAQQIEKIFKPLEPEYFIKDMYNKHGRIKFFSKRSDVIFPKVPWRWPSIDLMVAHDDGKYMWDPFEPKKFRAELKKVFPLHKRPFNGRWLYAPKDTFYFLRFWITEHDYCTTHYWTHLEEKYTKHVATKCSNLKGYIPFVHREWSNGLMNETLILNKTVIQSVLLPEERESVSEPYALRRIKDGR